MADMETRGWMPIETAPRDGAYTWWDESLEPLKDWSLPTPPEDTGHDKA